MQFCFDIARSICATYSDSFPFWQVLASALITVATIVASVILAKRSARREIDRFRESDRFERRSRAIATFAEMCADLLQGASKGDWDRFRFRKMVYMSRITIDSHFAERDTRVWMQNASLEVLDAIDVDSVPTDFTPAIEVMDKRIDDLRGWAWFEGSWQEYLESANVAPIRQFVDSSGALLDLSSTDDSSQ